MEREPSLFDAAGGMPFFEALVGHFYAGVAADPILRPIYPEADLAPAQRRLTLVLAQYWGGPRTYDEERGHPRLRMRHVPFAIDAVARDRWLLATSYSQTLYGRAGFDVVPDGLYMARVVPYEDAAS